MLLTLKSSHSGRQINENPVISSANGEAHGNHQKKKKIKPQMADSKNKDSDLIAVG